MQHCGFQGAIEAMRASGDMIRSGSRLWRVSRDTLHCSRGVTQPRTLTSSPGTLHCSRVVTQPLTLTSSPGTLHCSRGVIQPRTLTSSPGTLHCSRVVTQPRTLTSSPGTLHWSRGMTQPRTLNSNPGTLHCNRGMTQPRTLTSNPGTLHCNRGVIQPRTLTFGTRVSSARGMVSPGCYSRSLCGVPAYSRALCVSSQSRQCWSCQAVLSQAELFCPSCTSLQPPDENKDYFQILDCDKSFNVDIQELQKKYRDLQRLLHPDFFSQKSQHERAMSERQSSSVNKAYNTLLSPLSRGIYLLSLHGITFKDGADGGEVDPEFLFEIVEISEDLNEVSSVAEIEDIGSYVQDKFETLTEDVRKAFQQGDLREAKMLLEKMKYFSNILHQVKKKILP